MNSGRTIGSIIRPATAGAWPSPALQEDRHEGQHGEHPGREGKLRQAGAQVGGNAEVGEVEHRARLPALDDDEEGEQRERRRQLAEDPGIGPATTIALDERQRDEKQRAAEAGDPGQVETHGVGIARGVDYPDDERHPTRGRSAG